MRRILLSGIAVSAMLAQGAVAPALAQTDDRYPVPAAAIPYAPTNDETVTGTLPQPAVSAPFSTAAPGQASAAEIAAIRDIAALAKAGKVSDATARLGQLSTPIARKTAEWLILRQGGADLGRYAAFLRANEGWPIAIAVRRKAELSLYDSKADARTVRAFFAGQPPVTAKGRIALAIALKETGDARQAAELVRATWREDDLSAEVETRILANFAGVLTRDDHRYRFATLLYEGEKASALRAGTRIGMAELARAYIASDTKGGTVAVPAGQHADPVFALVQARVLRKADRFKEAAQILIAAKNDPHAPDKKDPWWVERRLVARKLLDLNEPQLAYRVAADFRGRDEGAKYEAEFHAGWIALRFLNDPATAQKHFTAMTRLATQPLGFSRAGYWLGRAAEARGDTGTAQRGYQLAAQHPTTYYGQLARAKLGLGDLPIRAAPTGATTRAAFARYEAVQALQLIEQAGLRDVAIAAYVDMARAMNEPSQLAQLAEVAVQSRHPRATMLVGKIAQLKGMSFDTHAFPVFGIPAFNAVGPTVDKAIVYAIARQESTFDTNVVSTAGARGLMQLMPGTAQITAKTYGLPYEMARLTRDPAYNATLGSAHLGELINQYNGSLILTFAAYNAGRGRVTQWIAAYGDPRDPKIDPIDWVERIPFTETRNYVQRVMENVQVYRARLNGQTRLAIEQDIRRGAPN